MRIRFIIIVVFVFFTGFEKVQSKVNFGAKLGLNFSQESSTPFLLEPFPALAVFTQHGTEVGVLVEGQISTSRWFYDAGLSFSRKGSKYETSDGLVQETGYNRINYLEVPLSLKYKLPMSNQPIKFYANAGLSVGLALTGNVEARQQQGSSVYRLKEKIIFGTGNDALFKKYDCGINFGLGFEMVDKVQIGGLYSLGLIDLYNENYQGAFRMQEPVKNRGWSLYLTVLF